MSPGIECLQEYQMAMAPRIRVWRIGGRVQHGTDLWIGGVDVMEFVDITGEWVTITLDQLQGAPSSS